MNIFWIFILVAILLLGWPALIYAQYAFMDNGFVDRLSKVSYAPKDIVRLRCFKIETTTILKPLVVVVVAAVIVAVLSASGVFDFYVNELDADDLKHAKYLAALIMIEDFCNVCRYFTLFVAVLSCLTFGLMSYGNLDAEKRNKVATLFAVATVLYVVYNLAIYMGITSDTFVEMLEKGRRGASRLIIIAYFAAVMWVIGFVFNFAADKILERKKS